MKSCAFLIMRICVVVMLSLDFLIAKQYSYRCSKRVCDKKPLNYSSTSQLFMILETSRTRHFFSPILNFIDLTFSFLFSFLV